MPHVLRGRASGLLALLGALGLALVVLVPPGLGAPPISLAPAPTASPPAAMGCPGPAVPGALLGSLVVVGGSSPPSPAGRTVNVSYEYALNFTPSGGRSTYSCLNGTAGATTGPTGAFSLTLPVPTSSCNRSDCALYSGPYAPVAAAIAGGTPGGYYLSSALSGSTLSLALVAALDHVDLSPSSRVTLSTDAPTPVVATPLAGNGAPSPATVAYAWRLAGAGWSLLNGSTTRSVVVEAADGAAPATLELFANGSYNGSAVAAPPVTLELAAATTTVTGATTFPTLLDVGTEVTFTVVGTGAGGYNYSATIDPGLNRPTLNATCAGALLEGGRLTLTCSASTAYATPGSASPTATLSNGFSSAGATFASLSVSSALEATVSPLPFETYVATTTAVRVTAGLATGTAPYGPACLWTGDLRVLCAAGAGPTYAIPVAWDYTGSYDARVSLADAGGANVTTPFLATVVARPQLGGISAPGPTPVGTTVPLESTLEGGAFPVTYWWNTTAPDGATTQTLYEGTTASDGPILFEYTPIQSGSVELSLTVRDALGTSLSQPVALTVTTGPFVRLLDRSATTGAPTVAGAPVPIDLEAVDAGGGIVPSTALAFTLALARPAGSVAPFWLNGSAGPIAGSNATFPTPSGPTGLTGATFAIPASRWQLGWLNLSLTLGGMGPWSLLFPSGLNVSDAPAGTRALDVVADGAHLRLVGAPTVPTGARSWSLNLTVTDRWGDPVPGSFLWLVSEFDGFNATARVPLAEAPGPLGNVSYALLRYTAPGSSPGSVELADPSWRPLLGPLAVLAATTPFPTVFGLGVLALLVVGVVASAALYRWRYRSRRRGPDPAALGSAEASEAQLRRLAEGRAHVLARADPTVGRTLDELAGGYDGPPPTPEELTDWVASLVAEGSLRTVLGDDGRSRFLLVGEPEPAPRVEIDDRALEEALGRRELDDDAGPGDAEDPPPPSG